MIVGKVW